MENEMNSFVFLDQEYTDLEELLRVMAEHWEEGKEILFDGSLPEHIREMSPDFSAICSDAKKESVSILQITEDEKADLAYFIWLLRMPGERPFLWKGEKMEEFEPVAGLLRQLCRQETSYYQRRYVFPLMHEFLFGDKEFLFEGQSFTDTDSLADWLQKTADQSPARLRSKGSKLFLDDTHLDPVFCGWLMRQGKLEAIEAWNRKYQKETGDGSMSPSGDVSC